MKKLKEDYIKNKKKNNNDNVYPTEFKPVEVKKVEVVPKPKEEVKPILTPYEKKEEIKRPKEISTPITPLTPIIPKMEPKTYYCYIYYYRKNEIPVITAILVTDETSREIHKFVMSIDIFNVDKLENLKDNPLYNTYIECVNKYKENVKDIDVYDKIIFNGLSKMNNFKDGLILNVKQEREDKNKCKDAYEKQLSELESPPISDNDSDYEISDNESDVLIKTNESIYVVYVMSQYAEFMLLRVIIKTENDDGNEQIIKYARFRESTRNAEELKNCYNELCKLNNEQGDRRYEITIEKQREEFNNIIYNYYPDVNIRYVEYKSDKEVESCYDSLSHNINLSSNILKRVVAKYEKNEGNGLRKAGLYDNIKDFINFRKDTKETLYYLLQRIIALENDMKTVKNKIVSNSIRTTFKDRNIDLNEDDYDEDADTNAR